MGLIFFRFAAYGGTGKVIQILDGASGQALFTIPCGGTVWSVALCGNFVAFGGEFSTFGIYNIEAKRDEVLSVNHVYRSSVAQ